MSSMLAEALEYVYMGGLTCRDKTDLLVNIKGYSRDERSICTLGREMFEALQ